MAKRSISYRTKPPFVTDPEPVAMYGVRTADTIKASGHHPPHQQAGHMTAPDLAYPRHIILANHGPSTHDDINEKRNAAGAPNDSDSPRYILSPRLIRLP